MKITNNKLESKPFVQTPNHGGIIVPEYIILHYTAGSSMKNTVAHFSKPTSKVSAHVVIGRDGTLTQMASFTTRCFHAGTSSWKGKDSCNGFSIGLEMVNYGKLTQNRAGLFYSWNGVLIGPDDVYTAPNGTHWHVYPHAQTNAVYSLCEALVKAYPTIIDVLDHEMVSPNRKQDVGPAFDLEAIRKHLFGREEAL